MKNLIASLFVLASIGAAHAEVAAPVSALRLVGTCVAVQAARLDDGSQSVDVIARAVAAGCMPILRTAMANDGALRPSMTPAAFLRDDVSDQFGMDDVIEDMAASAVTWLRGPGRSHVAELRGTPARSH